MMNTAVKPSGVKRSQAAAAARGDRTGRQTSSGVRPPSQAPAASRCNASEATKPAFPLAPACPRAGCRHTAPPAARMAATRPARPVQSSGSTASSRASRTITNRPNRVSAATIGTADTVSPTLSAPAMTAA